MNWPISMDGVEGSRAAGAEEVKYPDMLSDEEAAKAEREAEMSSPVLLNLLAKASTL